MDTGKMMACFFLLVLAIENEVGASVLRVPRGADGSAQLPQHIQQFQNQQTQRFSGFSDLTRQQQSLGYQGAPSLFENIKNRINDGHRENSRTKLRRKLNIPRKGEQIPTPPTRPVQPVQQQNHPQHQQKLSSGYSQLALSLFGINKTNFVKNTNSYKKSQVKVEEENGNILKEISKSNNLNEEALKKAQEKKEHEARKKVIEEENVRKKKLEENYSVQQAIGEQNTLINSHQAAIQKVIDAENKVKALQQANRKEVQEEEKRRTLERRKLSEKSISRKKLEEAARQKLIANEDKKILALQKVASKKSLQEVSRKIKLKRKRILKDHTQNRKDGKGAAITKKIETSQEAAIKKVLEDENKVKALQEAVRKENIQQATLVDTLESTPLATETKETQSVKKAIKDMTKYLQELEDLRKIEKLQEENRIKDLEKEKERDKDEELRQELARNNLLKENKRKSLINITTTASRTTTTAFTSTSTTTSTTTTTKASISPSTTTTTTTPTSTSTNTKAFTSPSTITTTSTPTTTTSPSTTTTTTTPTSTSTTTKASISPSTTTTTTTLTTTTSPSTTPTSTSTTTKASTSPSTTITTTTLTTTTRKTLTTSTTTTTTTTASKEALTQEEHRILPEAPRSAAIDQSNRKLNLVKKTKQDSSKNIFFKDTDTICPPAKLDTSLLFVPHPSDCGQYFVCFSDQPIAMACPGGLYFDPSLNICNFPQSVDCQYNLDQPVTSTSSVNSISPPDAMPATTVETTFISGMEETAVVES